MASATDLAILICSANLGNAEPSPQDLAAWVPEQGKCSSVTPLPEIGKIGKRTFDIIAVGMQESTWSSGKSKSKKVISTNGEEETDVNVDMEKAKKDISKLEHMLEDVVGSKYKLLAEQQRGEMRLVIFSRKDIFHDITDVQTKCENTGIAHVLANKGGIVTSFLYQSTTRIAFWSSHLAAHEGDKYYAARLDNIAEIFGGTKTHPLYDVALSSHHMFLLGDLNFRCRFPDATEDNPSVQQALALVEKGEFEKLYDHDELHKGIANKELLVDFETLPCHFNPTFKVLREPGYVYKEQRTPSYTDRILFRSATKGFLKPLVYEPCPGFTTSDHKPIRGAFSLTPNSEAVKQEQPCSYTLKFRNMSCQNLPALDVTGTSDPYIMCRWDYVAMGADIENKGVMKWTSQASNKWPKTKFMSRTLNPVYEGAEIDLTCNGPVGPEAMLYVTVMDYDLHSQDDLIATLPLNLRDFVAKLPKGVDRTTVEIDQPLLKYGTHHGNIKLAVDIARSDTPIDIKEMMHDDSCLAMLRRILCCCCQ